MHTTTNVSLTENNRLQKPPSPKINRPITSHEDTKIIINSTPPNEIPSPNSHLDLNAILYKCEERLNEEEWNHDEEIISYDECQCLIQYQK